MAVTTGGTYRNPKLGIQDYTAFGRGLASTFRLPEMKKEEEKKEQDIGVDIPEVEGGIDWYGGKDIDRTAEVKLNQNFAEDLGLRLKNNLENSKEGSQEYNKNLNRLDLINDAIGIDSNLAYLSNLIGDGRDVDINVSNLKLPGINPREESDYTIPQMYKRLHEGKMTPDIKVFDGIEYAGLRDTETNQFVNLSAMDKAYINKRVKERYDIVSSVLANDSFAKPYKNFTALKNEETVYKDKDGVEFKVSSGKKYYSDDQINYFDTAATNFSTAQAATSKADDTFDSLYFQVEKKIKAGEFVIKNDIDSNNKIAVVKDYLAEQYKLTHGSDYYSFDKETGRAIPRTQSNAFLFERDSIQQKPEGEDSFTPEDTTKLANEIKSYFTEGMLGEARKRLIDKSIKIPGLKEGVITNVTGSAGSLNIEYIDADFEKFEDKAGEPVKKSKTYDLRSAEDLLTHTNYLNLPLLQGQANATNRNNLLQELNK